jgi:hypothetical protein
MRISRDRRASTEAVRVVWAELSIADVAVVAYEKAQLLLLKGDTILRGQINKQVILLEVLAVIAGFNLQLRHPLIQNHDVCIPRASGSM